MNILPDKTVNIEFKNPISPKKKQQNINKNREPESPSPEVCVKLTGVLCLLM